MTTFTTFCNQNNFVGFNRPQMKTFINKDGEEKKTSPFEKCEGWKGYTQTTLRKDSNWKTNAVMTGKISEVTVIDFDNLDQLDIFRNTFPEFYDTAFKVKSQSGGIHFYCNYRPDIANVSNNDVGIDFRNDGGCIFSNGTEVLKNSGEVAKYEFIGGTKIDISDEIFDYFNNICSNFKTTKTAKPVKKITEVLVETDTEVNTDPEESDDGDDKTKMIEDLKKLDKRVWQCHANYYKIIFAICSVLNTKDYDFCKKVTNMFCNQTKKNEFDSWFASIEPKQSGLNKINWSTVKYLQPKIEKIQDLENKILTSGLLAEIFVELYGEDWIFKEEVLYHWNGVFWEKSDKKHSQLSMKIDKDFINYLLDYSTKISKETADDLKKMGNLVASIAKFRNDKTREGLKNDIMMNSVNNNIEFDTNPYLLTFNNVVFDLRTSEIIEPRRTDYVSISTGYNWKEPTKQEDAEIQRIISVILTNEEVRNYYLQILSTAISGFQLQNLFVATGKGGNGKSVINSLMLKAIGNYGYKIPSKLIQEELKTGSNPEVYNIGYKRFILGQEPSGKRKICSSVMKELTGDKTINARTHYSDKCSVMLMLTLLLECNGIPDLDEVNEAVERRIRIIEFESSFVSSQSKLDELTELGCINVFLGDSRLTTDEFQLKHRCAFIKLLMKHFIQFHKNNNSLMEMPEKVKKASANYLKSSDPFHDWFTTNYEKREKSIIYEADVYNKFKSSHYYSLLPKGAQRDLKKEVFIQKLKSNLFLSRILICKLRDERVDLGNVKLDQIRKDGFYGWAEKPTDEEEVEDM